MMKDSIALAVLLSSICSIDPLDDRIIYGVSDDSRNIKPGYLFIATPGETVDGRDYIQQAIAQGATVIIAEQKNYNFPKIPKEIAFYTVLDLQAHVSKIASRYYDHPSRKLKITGVTGTNGKTSICYFLAHALSQAALTAYIGTLGVGTPQNIEGSLNTTPGAIAIQGMLQKYYLRGFKYICMEVSSHGLHQNRVKHVEFSHAVFTNLTQDHLDYHQSMEAYFVAKEKLFHQFGLQHAVINLDDSWSNRLIKNLPGNVKKFTYSIHQKSADIYAENIQLSINGVAADVITPWGKGRLTATVIGKFNLSNLLAVLTILCLEHVNLQQALDLIATVPSVPGRMQIIKTPSSPTFIVDYSHTPDSLQQALITLRELKPHQIFCVFGCGGERDRTKRPIMGKIAELNADRIVITNDNPRREDPSQIINEILSGMSCPQQYQVEMSRERAIQKAFAVAGSEDVILIAGKGHENYQQIGEVKLPFSDEEVCMKLLRLS